jgi:hypothetical protein
MILSACVVKKMSHIGQGAFARALDMDRPLFRREDGRIVAGEDLDCRSVQDEARLFGIGIHHPLPS